MGSTILRCLMKETGSFFDAPTLPLITVKEGVLQGWRFLSMTMRRALRLQGRRRKEEHRVCDFLGWKYREEDGKPTCL